MPSRIERVLAAYRSQVLGRDSATLLLLSKRWGEVERALQDEIDALATELVEAERAGDAVNHAAWRRMARYRELERQARRVIERYQAWAQGVIESGQADYWQLGESFALEAMNARGAGLVGNFNRLPVTAVNEMIGMSGDGAPLFDVLRQRALAGASIDGLQQALINGIALGMNPRETARLMAGGLQAGLQKALVIARTEQLRAARRATILSYQANADILSGYEWVSALDPRTCAACWAMHGKFFPLDAEMPNDHICGRCTYVPVIRSRDERVESGAEQFARMGEERQKSILGPGRFDLYRRGVPLEKFARLRPDAVWGRTLELRPVREIIVSSSAAGNTERPTFYDWEVKDLRRTITTPLEGIDESGYQSVIVPQNVYEKLAIKHSSDLGFLYRLGEIVNFWDYSGISPKGTDKIEFYKKMDGTWFTAVIKGDKELQSYILTTFHRIYDRKIESRIKSGYLRARK